jgi:hypothetical protein
LPPRAEAYEPSRFAPFPYLLGVAESCRGRKYDIRRIL